MDKIFVSLIGYLLGCIQPAYLFGRFIHKTDIRDIGSGNAGASNATMSFGMKIGFLTGLIDILKAIFAVLITKFFFASGMEGVRYNELVYLTGLFVILGHNFPFYMKFRGGKGTSALVGLMLAIDIRLGLVGGVAIVIVSLIADHIAIGTVAMLAVFFIYSILVDLSVISLVAAFVIVVMSLYKHYPNFVRIKNHEESSVKATLFKKKK